MTGSEPLDCTGAIAVIGMAGRFPGAPDIGSFWQNLKDGVESISRFSDDELLEAGVDPALLRAAGYVKAGGCMEGAELFDAAFFGFAAREAEYTDPQHRVFLECSWEALEHAGYCPEASGGTIGVFAGCSMNTYFILNLLANAQALKTMNVLQMYVGNDKDYLSTRVSYKLNLKGPSITVQSACSTSLTAVQLACLNLLNYQCDMALAGGVFVQVPRKQGYVCAEGNILSPDGRCRAFDAGANGTVFGEGAGAVVLKRLSDALRDRDTVYGVIKGIAINNDGSAKIGFTAPSVEGQAEVIALAQAVADVDPATIGYVEAHGTGTPLGDPIEVAALTQAFRARSPQKGFCALGSVKTNIGHLDAAAGVTSLIKTVLMLHHKLMPPSLHFSRANPNINFDESPFYVNTKLAAWEAAGMPRRAGVSSLGVGGTNVHAVLEEAPQKEESGPSRPWKLIALSARTEAALEMMTGNLADHIDRNPDINLADAAYTLQVGRRSFRCRRMVLCRTAEDCSRSLRTGDPRSVVSAPCDTSEKPAVFMLPGEGSSSLSRGRELYQTEPLFRKEIDQCASYISASAGFALRSFFNEQQQAQKPSPQNEGTIPFTSSALFAFEYALARVFMSWGLAPRALMGCGIGEAAAACLAGIISPDTALQLVALREKCGHKSSDGVSEGPQGKAQETADDQLAALIKKIAPRQPAIPVFSIRAGAWLTPDMVCTPWFWTGEAAGAERFSPAVSEVVKNDAVLLEFGPGVAMGAGLHQSTEFSAGEIAIPIFPEKNNGEAADALLVQALGRLWLAGVHIDWIGFSAFERRFRISLPTYPFERQRYWIEPDKPFLESLQTLSVKDAGGFSREHDFRTPPGRQQEETSLPESHPRPALSVAYAPALTETQKRLVKLWEEVLGISGIGINDDFFELGGDSITAVQITARSRQELGIELPLRILFDKPTASTLADYVEHTLKGGEKSRAEQTLPLLPAQRSGDLPLSPSQERLWFIHQLQPESPAYNIVQGIRIQGKLDYEIFRQALAAIVMRHETLRMRFVSAEGRPQALIDSAAGPAIEIIDAVKSAVMEAEAEARSIVRREAVKPFDLEKGPLYRGLLFKTGATDYVFVFIFHHIIADGWSMGVWLQELSSLYEALAAGGRSPLPALEIQYTDYAAWQRTWIAKKDFSADIAFWKQRLGGKLPVLQMPADYPRPENPHNDGALEAFVIPEPLVRVLADYAQKESCTLFMMLLAGFMALLQRYTGQETIIIGSPYANRNMVECERLIGFFLNMLPLRGDLSPDMPFKELLHQVRESTLEAYSHHELPFGTLVEAIQPERSLNHHPVFQIMFAFQNFPLSCKSTAGIFFQPLFFDRGATEFDLALYMWEEGSQLRGAFEYSTELFQPETIARLAGHFMALLGGIAQDPSQKLQAIPLLTQRELVSFADGWKETEAAYPVDATAAELFEAQVGRVGDLPAVIYNNVTVTYRELNRRANQLARILQNKGVGPDVLVGVFLERSIDMVVAVLGIHKAGGAYVPLDPAFPRDRLEFMMEDSGIQVLLTQESLASEVPAACPARVIVLDRDRDEIGRQSGENTGKTAGGGNLAYVIYTSGSTGKPKGVEIEHRALVNFLLSMQREPGLVRQDILLSVTTLSFDIAGLELLLPLITGAGVVLASRDEAIDGFRLKQMLKDFRATVMQATPATWKMLLDAGLQDARGLKILCGGEALSGELAGRILETGAELWNMYGPTETTIWSSVCRVENGRKAPDIGHPIANTQFYILDELKALVPVGIAGELYIGGDGLARGYLSRTELTAERFPPDPFAGRPGARMYRTGDLVRRKADGKIEFLGRTDHQVKIRGYRIELGEIELAIGRHPQVKEAVVVAREDEPDNKRLAAYIIEEPGMPVDRGELREYVQQSLPDYMTPSFFVMLESFPLTPNGKIDRKALPQPDMQASREEYSFVAPRDQLEIQLANIWQKMLGVKSISIKDNYFDLGGNSLMATRLFAQIEKITGNTIPLATLFRAPTIEQIAGIIRQKDWKPSWSSLIPIQPGGTKPPLFLVHGAGGNVLLYRPLAQRLGPDQPVYGLQAKGLDGAEPFYTRIEDMAEHYIEEMKKFQPEGPYYLGGYCMGGAIAYEMACRLERQGDRAAIVAMFDTFNGWKPETFFSSMIHLYQRIAFHAKNVLMIQGPGRRAFLRQKAMESQRRVTLAASVAASRIARRLGLRKENPPVILDDVNDAAVIQYRPGRYAGRITVFAPCDAYAGYEDPQLGWGGMASGGVDIIGLKAYPAGMLVDPFVAVLAEKLQACLENARTTHGSAQAD